MSDHARVDVAAVINDSEIGRFQYLIFALCILIMMCDGFDTQALAYVAPSIASEWKLAPGSFGPVFAAVLLGSMAGAFAFGYLADRFGRKRTLLLCVIWFGMLNVGSAYANSIESFTLLRFLCGIGLGGAIPNVMALVSEYAPARKRATLVAVAWCGFSLGAVLGGTPRGRGADVDQHRHPAAEDDRVLEKVDHGRTPVMPLGERGESGRSRFRPSRER